jgi:hypothetical protein
LLSICKALGSIHSTAAKKKKKVIDLYVRVTVMKLIEENLGASLCDLELGSGFLDMTLKA